MTETEKMRSLALSRLQQAEESLDEAQFLFDGRRDERIGFTAEAQRTQKKA